MKQERGITLIALVITIIVLLILAGVTINLTLGEHGMFRTAEKATQNYTEAQDKELAGLGNFDKEVENIIGNLGNGGTGSGNKINYVDDGEGNKIPVPEGFTHTVGTKNEGFVIKNNKDNNELVWVPVAGMSYSYERHDFKGILCSHTSEILPTDEANSVDIYGGYYIGRYEAGIEGYTNLTEAENSIAPSTNWTGYEGGKLVIQSEKQVWNWITRDKAKEIAEGLYNKNEDNVKSKLCSSYAWDTALKFMESTGSTYPTNSVGGYYRRPFGSGSTTTGYDKTHPCNIYDMGGNVWEWTTETCSGGDCPCVRRGGSCNNGAADDPAAYRNGDDKDNVGDYTSFRVTLFM